MDDRSGYQETLLRRAARWPDQPDFTALTVPVLRELAAREGQDFAVALLYHRLRQSSRHGSFIRAVEGLPENGGGPLDAAVAVVPGAGWAEYPHTGADGRRLRSILKELGVMTELIPVQSFGMLADNARIIADWLLEHRSRPVILVSLSKGAADVKTALARQETADAFGQVALWLDLSGISLGTPLVDWWLGQWYRRWPIRIFCWWRGYPYAFLEELRYGPGGSLDFPAPLPRTLQVVHVVGFPVVGASEKTGGRYTARRAAALGHKGGLSSELAKRTHRRLGPLGPNDAGGILLGDVGRLPGLVYPVWNADHYLNPTWDIRPLIGRLLRWATLQLRPAAGAPPVVEVIS